MIMKNKVNGNITFRRVPELNNLEMLRAVDVKHSFSRHMHKVYCIGAVEQGVRAYFYRGTKHFIPAGGMMLINPGEVHACSAGDKNGYSYRMICPADSLLMSAFEDNKWPQNAPWFKQPGIDDPGLFEDFINLCHVLSNSPSRLEKQSCFILFIFKLISLYEDRCPVAAAWGKSGHERTAVRLVRDYLEENCNTNISIEFLAGVAGLSPFHLIRVFSKEIGIPPHTYQTNVRIRHARKLLTQGLPIIQAALETGFVDQSHFTRCFKKVMGITPGQYVSAVKG